MDIESTIQLTNLHYFFSTAPQVLGAMLAITGAFVVFKLEHLRKELISAMNQVEEALYEDKIQVREAFRGLNIAFDTSLFQICKYSRDFKPLRNVIESVKDILSNEISKVDIISNIRARKDNSVFFTRLYARLDCVTFLARESDLSRFIKRTKYLFWVNGIVVILLLAFFFLIPVIASSQLSIIYWTSLAFGWIITSLSFISIIYFMIVSLTNKTKRRDKATEELLLFNEKYPPPPQ